jgi:metallo-beta-lactamase class B
MLASACTLMAQPTPLFRSWNQPRPPFRIAGSLYYVGMSQVTSLLITTPQGHILIDGAFAESAASILENVRKLGFKPEDIKILLSTHAHLDHAGGLAAIKTATKARLYAGSEDVPVLANGGRQDFAFGDKLPFPPVVADVSMKDGDAVTLGNMVVRAVSTPGHTKGCTSWTFTVQEQGKPLRVVVVGGTSVLEGCPLTANPSYPKIASDFESTFARLKSLPCDIPIEGHGFFFLLDEKAAGKRSFVDPEGYQSTVTEAESCFRARLKQQKTEGTKP